MGWSDVLSDLTTSASAAYQSYNNAQSGFTPLAPGTYVGPNGQVVTTNSPIGVTTSTSTTLLLLGVLAVVFLFAFMWMKK